MFINDLLMCTYPSKARFGHPDFWDCLNTFYSLKGIVYTSISLIKEFASEVIEMYFTETATKVSQLSSRWSRRLHIQKGPSYFIFSGCKNVCSLSVNHKWGENPEDFEHMRWNHGICVRAAMASSFWNSPNGSHLLQPRTSANSPFGYQLDPGMHRLVPPGRWWR